MKIMAYGISAAHIVLIAVSVHNDLYYKTMDISYNVKMCDFMLLFQSIRFVFAFSLALSFLWHCFSPIVASGGTTEA